MQLNFKTLWFSAGGVCISQAVNLVIPHLMPKAARFCEIAFWGAFMRAILKDARCFSINTKAVLAFPVFFNAIGAHFFIKRHEFVVSALFGEVHNRHP